MRLRSARPSDLRHLAPIEESGGALFVEHLGEQRAAPLLGDPPSGFERADRPGEIVVADDEGTVVGFVHVLWLEDAEGTHAHLEQLSVLPSRGRRGIGRALVGQAVDEARWAGHDELTLCTFRDVPWNGPFYARSGFEEVVRPTGHLAAIREAERVLGLDECGPRLAMRRVVTRW
ncbi:GNAT family N-acetyltransferase [Nocardioides acrostichi]|uniref:GNAT family N-acetyltransferase n=1 Tax=Nocardioides acrostichi TaxID=2784339 RepID=A0A930V2G5_9ACTN|nr:GNAT family N-acetyltransferase [Nocardioides acrostichi]MBF4162794.1 GNAT family N-acetyltransferase [Nocardioides acrostichi]